MEGEHVYNSIYPINIKPYSGPRKGSIPQDKDDDARSGGNGGYSGQGGNNQQYPRDIKNFYRTRTFSTPVVDNFQRTTPTLQEQPIANQGLQDEINISQVLVDFKNTVNAIGVPEELDEELNGYFTLIQKQAQKPEPNKKLIQSNLKNASTVLDKYISDTLSRPSNVVENWIDTLFLQNVDYKYNEEKINPEFQLKFPERKEQQQETIQPPPQDPIMQAQREAKKADEANATIPIKPVAKFYVPQDKNLKKEFLQAKKYALANRPQEALECFQSALKRSIALNDEQAQSLIFFEAAKVFDKEDLLAPALKNYYKAAVKSKDYNVKTKAHYNMAKIYDDCVKTQPAMEHYFVALSYAGESEALTTQSASLANIAGLHAERSKKRETKEFTRLSENMARETKNSKVIGAILAKGGENFTTLGEPKTALSYYKKSTKHFRRIEEPQKVAQNLEKAAELMLELGNIAKAKKLYRNAYEHYSMIEDTKAMKYIFDQLNKLQA